MYKALHLSPMIPSYNIQETAAFFINILNFTFYMNEEGYVIMVKDNLMIHILNAGDIGEMEFYLQIDDVDSLWEEIKDKLTGLEVRPPFNREYGMREMHIIIPQTKTLLFVGHAIKNNSAL